MKRVGVMLAGSGTRIALAVVLALCNKALSQQSTLGPNCKLADFSRDLASAMAAGDAGRLGLLVIYPMRVNDSHGSYWIKDAGSLQGRLDEIFPTAVRKAVTNQQIDSSACDAAKFMYGDGMVWVELTDHGYEIFAVNVPGNDNRMSRGRVRFTCNAEPYRVIVDLGPSGQLRYRAWKAGHSLMEQPDTQLLGGSETGEGTGGCFYSAWSFGKGESRVSVEGLGCAANHPPDGTTGQLVLADGKSYWCF